MRLEDTKQLRKIWADGKASGDATPVDFAALRREAQQRLKASADLEDVLVSRSRRRENGIPIATVKANLIASGKLGG